MALAAWISLFWAIPGQVSLEAGDVLLVDASASMAEHTPRGSRYESASRLARLLLSEQEGALLGFIGGGCGPTPAPDSPNPNQLDAQLHRQPAGSTPLAAAIRSARAENPARIVVITDGLDTCGGDLDDQFRRASLEGIEIWIVVDDAAPEARQAYELLAQENPSLHVNSLAEVERNVAERAIEHLVVQEEPRQRAPMAEPGPEPMTRLAFRLPRRPISPPAHSEPAEPVEPEPPAEAAEEADIQEEAEVPQPRRRQVEMPKPVDGASISYPRLARRFGLTGTVALRLVISATGRVESASIAESSGSQILDDHALESVSEWQFESGRIDGQAIRGAMTLRIVFSLVGGSGSARLT